MGAKIGHIVTGETRKKISNNSAKYWLGKKLPKITRKKISKKITKFWKEHPEVRRRISEKLKGVLKSEETRRRMGEAQKEYLNRPEIKEIRSKRMLGKNYGNQPIVHHINGNHKDNRKENRMNMTRSEHFKLHWEQGDIVGGGRPMGSKNITK